MNQKQNISYLDYNSTTPVDPRVVDAMLPYLKDNFGNSSSTHHFGQIISENVKQARNQIARFIKSEPNEVVFTSGATEAINLSMKGIAESYKHKGSHIITVSTEHKAVLDTCGDLERKGFEVTYLPVEENGLLSLELLERSIRPDTILVSVMYVNNETGVIQPIKKFAEITHQKGALFMTDATQAVGKIAVDVKELDIDLLCFSGHKMYAPKGVGALFIRKNDKRVNITPQTHGGGHETGLRSGTLNVPGIVALAKACEISSHEMNEDRTIISELRDKLEYELLRMPNTALNGDSIKRIYNTTNICFKEQDANVLIGRMRNIAVSNGSACSSAIFEPSHVLKSMGLSNDDALASLRFSLGKYNTIEDVELVVETIRKLTEPQSKYA
ncbi:cysteine desulfurase family protein [Galbibacter sp. PAP.153]|uniref:cysteine desulfurase family protein n=1 Tax=Galbibacter sp. PAP.153 TaxID=3104623 RepID=UPI00300A45F4